MSTFGSQPPAVSRRSVLRRGKKLAYVAPVVVAAMKAQPAFAASGGGASQPSKPK
jgi:hypothetical protein